MSKLIVDGVRQSSFQPRDVPFLTWFSGGSHSFLSLRGIFNISSTLPFLLSHPSSLRHNKLTHKAPPLKPQTQNKTKSSPTRKAGHQRRKRNEIVTNLLMLMIITTLMRLKLINPSIPLLTQLAIERFSCFARGFRL